jgi:hypothetical protein
LINIHISVFLHDVILPRPYDASRSGEKLFLSSKTKWKKQWVILRSLPMTSALLWFSGEKLWQM